MQYRNSIELEDMSIELEDMSCEIKYTDTLSLTIFDIHYINQFHLKKFNILSIYQNNKIVLFLDIFRVPIYFVYLQVGN